METLNNYLPLCGMTYHEYIKLVFIEPFAEKAISFASQNAVQRISSGSQQLKCSQAIRIHAYIMQILNDSNFQSRPTQFMQDWKERRGNTQEFRLVEDCAMIFFETIVLPTLAQRANS